MPNLLPRPCKLARAPVLVGAIVLGLAATAPAMAGDNDRREAGAHEHGRGTLNIALDGNRLLLELEAPGDDLLGFEHEAHSAAEKATRDSVDARLREPLTLFVLPEAAGCKVAAVKVGLADEDDEPGKDGHTRRSASPHDRHAHGAHASVEAEYDIACATPSALTRIDLAYFKAFPRARSLTVNVVTPKGQSTFAATPADPTVKLGGQM